MLPHPQVPTVRVRVPCYCTVGDAEATLPARAAFWSTLSGGLGAQAGCPRWCSPTPLGLAPGSAASGNIYIGAGELPTSATARTAHIVGQRSAVGVPLSTIDKQARDNAEYRRSWGIDRRALPSSRTSSPIFDDDEPFAYSIRVRWQHPLLLLPAKQWVPARLRRLLPPRSRARIIIRLQISA